MKEIIFPSFNLKLNVNNVALSLFGVDIYWYAILIVLAFVVGILFCKKDSGKYCITGIEMLVLSLVTVALMYITIMYPAKYIYITSAVSFVFAIYYVGKAIVLYCKTKKNYSIDSMNKIIKNK